MDSAVFYVLFLLISIVSYWAIIPDHLKSPFLLFLSLAFVGSLNIFCLVYFSANILITHRLSHLLTGKKPKMRMRILQLAILWLIGNLSFFKYTNQVFSVFIDLFGLDIPAIAQFPRLYLPVGLSYITFRLAHYIVEVYRGTFPPASIINLFNFTLFFPTFLCGPVERFQNFFPQSQRTGTLNPEDLNYGFYRILKGVFKKVVMADIFLAFVLPTLQSPAEASRVMLLASIYGIAFKLYMDFSGYTDIAIGISRLFGFKIVENFENPYLKENVALFWRSWHISIHDWIRDYFFFPLFGTQTSRIKLYMGILLSMLVFQIWHAASLSFLFLGFYHGLGLIFWHLFQEIKKKSPFLNRFLQKKYLKPFGVILTFTFVSIGTVFVLIDFSTGIFIVGKAFGIGSL